MLTAVPEAGVPVIVEFDDTPPLTYTFTTRVLQGTEWERLLLDHRPVTEGFDYNPATFPPAAIAESVTAWTITQGDTILEQEERPPTVDEAVELWGTWPQWARTRLLRAIEVQNVSGPALGKRLGRRNV